MRSAAGWSANGPVPRSPLRDPEPISSLAGGRGFHLQHRLETCLLPVVTTV